MIYAVEPQPLRARAWRRGIALVAVLAILTVLAVLTVAFALLTSMEQASVRINMANIEARLLAEAGFEHARASLWFDATMADPRYDAPDDGWRASFNGCALNRKAEVDLDHVTTNGSAGTGADAMWINVHDLRGALIGRYAVMIEDEAGKVNVTSASIVPPRRACDGLDPSEVMLGDGAGRGLPLPLKALATLQAYKYGANGVPGTEGDDNNNNAALMADGLDNNANGLVDELDEGVNEPDEYVPGHPYGDDRALLSLAEAWRVATAPNESQVPPPADLRAFGTLVSCDDNRRWDASEQAWEPRRNLNTGAAREIHRSLSQAAKGYAFEGNPVELRRLAAVIADYCDENSTLSTVAGSYGIEAVCFNEILANEGSRIRQTYYVQDYRRDDIRVHNLAYLYSDYSYRSNGNPQDDDPVQREQGHNDTAWAIIPLSVEISDGGLRLRLETAPWGDPSGYYNNVRDFKNLLRSRGSPWLQADTILWPDNAWANAYLCVFGLQGMQIKSTPEKAFKIAHSTGRDLYLDPGGISPEDCGKFTTTYFCAQLRSWVFEKAYYAEHPLVSDWFVFSGLQPDKYYRVYLQETNLETPTGDTAGGQRLSDRLDVDGSFDQHSEQTMARLRYKYRDGAGIRADSKGCMDVFVTSSADCSPRRRNRVNAAYIARPDIIELINASSRPVSLRGWRLIANTGSITYELGVIDSSMQFSGKDGARQIEANPAIMPHSYFYLCNNAELFDRDFGGSKDGLWGSTSDEQAPVFELGDDAWGVRFKIRAISETGGSGGAQSWTHVSCGSETWKPHQFEQEVVEFQSDRKSPPGMATSPDGVRALVFDNTRNTLMFESLLLKTYSDVREGDYAMIVGLPRVGGFVSMTLKNDYDQISARLIEYGNPGVEAERSPDRWLGWSSEKLTPTREDWVLTQSPSIGGTPVLARNRATRPGVFDDTSVRNGPYGSVAGVEMAWRLAAQPGGGPARATALVKAAADYFDVAGMRLDAEEEGAHVAGWQPAFGEAAASDTRGITDKHARWQPGIWSNQTLHLLSGAHRGEFFAVEDNTPSSMRITGRSVPGRTTFAVRKGDRFALGPAHGSAMFFTRLDNDAGEWEWKDRRIPPGSYQLFIAGLNDSIHTSEFIEENHNPALDVHLYNFETKDYDLLAERKRYEKNDRLFAGTLKPCHLSATGGMRLKLVPHGVNDQNCRGFAWFDHAYLAALPVNGRVNVNTASPRVLGALNGVDAALARDIARGVDSSGTARLKPYTTPGDLLAVRGMTIARFAGMANLVTVRSDQFTIRIAAQRIADVNRDGVFDPKQGDRIEAVARLRRVVDRGKPGSPGRLRILEPE